ncbi:hypothetical protein M5K25_018116 [Dendrobium thyrsiflorum]|uniref:Uncharacterized protein n=1 Tax=Dendrobium thyrsiflorum TaxID=117978 RepID=A0ABD0UH50_DENTH
MQKNIITNPTLAQPADYQSSIPTNLSTNPVPQADQLVHLQTHQNVASASEPVMTPQPESIINEKIKAVIASEQVEKFTTIADLALEKRKKSESVTKYITRWRNMSMKCEQQLKEEHAVQLLMGNIDDKMLPYLCMASINTYQELLDRVAKFEKLNLSKNKAVDTRRDDVYSASSLRIDKEKQSTPKDDKGKQYTNPRPQPKLMLGGNDKSQTFRDGGERSKLRTEDKSKGKMMSGKDE